MITIDRNNLRVEQLNGIYEELAEIIGLDMVLRVYMQYKGQQVNFPTRFYSKQYIENKIIQEFDGSNLGSLSVKYGFSERWIREIIKRAGHDKRNK